MKYLNCTINRWSGCLVLLVCLFLTLTTTNNAIAQCSLACNGSTQVSLDVFCEAMITPEMILNDQNTSCPMGDFIVELSTQYVDIPTSPMVTGDYMGETIIASVIETNSQNSCWGYLVIEDKLGPTIDSCPTAPIEIACSDLAVYEGPTYIDACEGEVEPILLSEVIDPIDCDDDYIKQITRVYTAVDSKGYYAPQCTITYLLLRIDFEDVTCPEEYTIAEDNALSCEGVWKMGQGGYQLDTDTNNDGILDADLKWDDNDNDYPEPLEIGVPTIESMVNDSVFELALYPYPDIYCNSLMTFSDIELPKIGCVRKIMRTWTLREWHCNGEETFTCLQIIEIVDEEGPTVTCPDPFHLTTNTLTGATNSHYGSVTCGVTTSLPLPAAEDNCSTNLSYDVTYDGGFAANYNGTSPLLLPMGTNFVTYAVYDECYNSSTCSVFVEVLDNTPPVAVCDQFTVVSLTTGGKAKVHATSFDDGSYDDCKDHCMLVRRMDTRDCECSIPTFCDLNYLGAYNGSYYYLSTYDITATIAKNRAAAYGGSLAIFNTIDEEAWVNTQVRKSYDDNYWIGMKRFGNGFLWDDHSSVLYSNWEVNYPQTTLGGNCVLVNDNDKWEDFICAGEARYVLEIKDICGFNETATFCCSDVGEDNMVVFRVVDVFGNYNDCMVSVNVQDKLPPVITCPPHEEVDCDTPYDPDNLTLAFGYATVIDDCGATITDEVDDRTNQCNIGELIRIFTATDEGGRTSTCKQIIYFDNDDPFDGDIIVCPGDTTIIGCLNPEELGTDAFGSPSFIGDHCDLIGTDYDDEIFTFNNTNSNANACFKILRTWDIVDWCQQDTITGKFEIWTCQQVIKVVDDQKPVITSGCDSTSVCTYDSDCIEGFVELIATAEDACTTAENLRWEYALYAGGINTTPDVNGIPYDSDYGEGNTINASQDLPIGDHIIRYTFFDRCGNATSCFKDIRVMNCKQPTAYCINGLAVDLMAIDEDFDGDIDFGMVELWASDFDAGSSHPCGYDVFLSFSPDTSERNMVFDCTTRGDQEVEIWATVVGPDGNLIQSYCETFVNVQDNQGACVGQLDVTVDVEGVIYTEELEQVEAVDVKLEGSELDTRTDISGKYAFPNMSTGGDYMVNPYSNQDPLNGVSTLDIITIQKHILGLEQLSSPYKIIAADVNNDNNLSSLDLIELRKLILGIYDELPNNDSWRFVDKGYVFQDPVNPFNESFVEDYEIYGLNTDMNIDFIAVKTGDVNNSAQVNSQSGNTQQSISTMIVDYELQEVESNEIVRIPFFSNNATVNGYQFTLTFDNNALDVQGLEGLNASNYRIVNDNQVVVSWNNDNTKNLQGEMFTVVAKAKKAGKLENVFELNSELVKSEAYNENGEVFTPVIKGFENNENSNYTFELFQNSPNPFTANTNVKFILPQAQDATISIHDVHGKLLKRYTSTYNKGSNNLNLNASDLGATGVMYLTLQTDTHTGTIKMVVLK